MHKRDRGLSPASGGALNWLRRLHGSETGGQEPSPPWGVGVELRAKVLAGTRGSWGLPRVSTEALTSEVPCECGKTRDKC